MNAPDARPAVPARLTILRLDVPEAPDATAGSHVPDVLTADATPTVLERRAGRLLISRGRGARRQGRP